MHLLASWAEETTFSPLSSISSKRLEYLDNLRMVASGIFLYFNFVTPFTSFGKKILNSHFFVKYIFMSRFAPCFQAHHLLFYIFPVATSPFLLAICLMASSSLRLANSSNSSVYSRLWTPFPFFAEL